MTDSIISFFARLPKDQLTHLHISGLPSLRLVGQAIESQKNSLCFLKVDYLRSKHGTTVDESVLPVLPNIRDIVFDVADLSEVKATHMVKFLQGIRNKEDVVTLYFPHVQILGNLEEIRPVIEELGRIGEYGNIKQMVIRFHSLVLPLNEFYSLREKLAFLPACCLSRSFVVALDHWAAWWPPINEVWKDQQQLSGRSLFKEQIDFASLGVCADREWLRLGRGRKEFWNNKILPKIHAMRKKLEQHKTRKPRE